MKKIIAVILLICLSFTLFACKMESDYYKDISDYTDICYLEGMRIDYADHSPVFPASIENLQVEDFFCRHDIMLPVGEEIQIYLKVKYDSESFAAEIERIASVSEECSDMFDSSLDYKAYCAELGKDIDTDGWEDDYEYALIDENEQTVQYIYLIYLDKDEIEFSTELLPLNYMDYSEKLTMPK